MTMRLILVRHGESLLGSVNRYAGRTDTRLSPEGRRQVLELAERFRRFRADGVFSSDLLRCRETVELLAPRSRIEYTASLRELDFGEWEGLSPEECSVSHPMRYRRWMEDPRSEDPPGGESLDDLARRVFAFADLVADRFRRRTAVFVTHGGPIRVFLDPGLENIRRIVVRPAEPVILNWEGPRIAAP
jgi:broad specificity phosphatase PhoE